MEYSQWHSDWHVLCFFLGLIVILWVSLKSTDLVLHLFHQQTCSAILLAMLISLLSLFSQYFNLLVCVQHIGEQTIVRLQTLDNSKIDAAEDSWNTHLGKLAHCYYYITLEYKLITNLFFSIGSNRKIRKRGKKKNILCEESHSFLHPIMNFSNWLFFHHNKL